MPYINIKQTIWDQYYVPDDIEVPEFTDDEGVWKFILDNDLEAETIECGDLFPEDNGGFSTIEVADDEFNIVYQNGKDS